MYTTKYKGYYIHGYTNKPEVCWQDVDVSLFREAKSLHAAKLQITKHIKEVG